VRTSALTAPSNYWAWLSCYFASVPKEGLPSGHAASRFSFLPSSCSSVPSSQKVIVDDDDLTFNTLTSPTRTRQLRRSPDCHVHSYTHARAATLRTRICRTATNAAHHVTRLPAPQQDAVLQERLQVQGRAALCLQSRQPRRACRQAKATMGGILVAQRGCARGYSRADPRLHARNEVEGYAHT
jgi:hypothetical protein